MRISTCPRTARRAGSLSELRRGGCEWRVLHRKNGVTFCVWPVPSTIVNGLYDEMWQQTSARYKNACALDQLSCPMVQAPRVNLGRNSIRNITLLHKTQVVARPNQWCNPAPPLPRWAMDFNDWSDDDVKAPARVAKRQASTLSRGALKQERDSPVRPGQMKRRHSTSSYTWPKSLKTLDAGAQVGASHKYTFNSDAFHLNAQDIKRRSRAVRVGTDFSGMDTVLWALHDAGVPIDHVFSCENHAPCMKLIMHHHAPRKLYVDIERRYPRTTPAVDVYVAGFPCQPFSSAGLCLGSEDPARGTLANHCLKYIEAQRPRVVVLENVLGLFHRHRSTYDCIVAELEKKAVPCFPQKEPAL